MKTLSTGVITGGIAIGNAFVYKASQKEADTYIPKSIEEENQILQTALAGVKNELSVLAESDEIFAAHYEMADDPMIEEQAASLIEEGLGAYDAVLQTSDALCAMFDEIDDEYLKARKDDVKDVCRRIARKITGEDKHSPFEGMAEGSIIVAEELVPSDTAQMDLNKVEGFVTALGSRTSHVCIIAASKDITAMVGVEGCTTEVNDGDALILDGEKGLVIINPDEEVLSEYKMKVAELESAEYDPNKTIYTEGGERIWILGNAGNPEDVEAAVKAGEAITTAAQAYKWTASSSNDWKYTPMLEVNDKYVKINGKPIDEIIDDATGVSIRKEKDNMNNLFKGFDFGSCENDNVKMSIYGVAVKNNNGTWVSYDSKSGNVIDVDILNFSAKYLYKMPVAIKDIAPGDVVIHI